MPYYREVLLSAWPVNTITEVGLPPVKIDPQTLATLQEREWGFYGKNTRPLRRNQVEDVRSNEGPQSTLKHPKFLSEKARELAKSPAGTPAPEEVVPEIPLIIHDSKLESHKVEVPELYQHIEIKYSKFGIDDFDFGFVSGTIIGIVALIRIGTSTSRSILDSRITSLMPMQTLCCKSCTIPH